MPEQRLRFAKTGRARFISHLDLMRTFQRAFQRAGVQVRRTEGFNPHPFVSIALPLSLGYSSDCELLEFGLLGGAELDQVPEKLNAVLPEGVRVLDCYDALRPVKAIAFVDYAARWEFDTPGAAPQAAERLEQNLQKNSLIVTKTSKKAKSGQVEVDLIPLIRSFSVSVKETYLTLNLVIRAQNPGLNPILLLEVLPPELRPDYTTFHRRALLDQSGEFFR